MIKLKKEIKKDYKVYNIIKRRWEVVTDIDSTSIMTEDKYYYKLDGSQYTGEFYAPELSLTELDYFKGTGIFTPIYDDYCSVELTKEEIKEILGCLNPNFPETHVNIGKKLNTVMNDGL